MTAESMRRRHGGCAAWLLLVALCGAMGCEEDLDLGDNPPGPCDDAGTACTVDGGTECVALDSDPAHCGTCGNECPSAVCVGGLCCDGDMPRECRGACVDVASDPDNCGDCGAPCATGQCAGGVCCAAEDVLCEDAEGRLSCVDLGRDPAHCGDCGNACASEVCSDGVCCEELDGTVCEDAEGTPVCVDLASDPLHCGQCGRECACRERECCEHACGKRCVEPYGPPAQAMGPEETRMTLLEDLDQDGRDELILPNQLDGSVWVYWGNPEGLGVPQQILDTGRVGAAMTVGDVDEDGYVDVLSAVQSHGPPTADEILVLHGSEDWSFERRTIVDEPNNPILMTLLRADDDEHLDLVMRLPGNAGWKTVLRRGDGAGGLGERQDLLDFGTLSENDPVVGGDLDGDGRDELLEIRNGPANEILVHHFDATGLVDAARDEVRTLPEGVRAEFLDLHDIDQDAEGLPEIVAIAPVFQDQALAGWELLGLREQGLCPLAALDIVQVMIADFPQNEIVRGIGDFDGNGILDISGFATCGFCQSVHFLHFGGR